LLSPRLRFCSRKPFDTFGSDRCDIRFKPIFVHCDDVQSLRQILDQKRIVGCSTKTQTQTPCASTRFFPVYVVIVHAYAIASKPIFLYCSAQSNQPAP